MRRSANECARAIQKARFSATFRLPDLMPLLHARDAAEAKVASIGTVNPRAPGLINSIVQSIKRLVARALDWHVREQIEFNRAVIECVQATIETLNGCNRLIASNEFQKDQGPRDRIGSSGAPAGNSGWRPPKFSSCVVSPNCRLPSSIA